MIKLVVIPTYLLLDEIAKTATSFPRKQEYSKQSIQLRGGTKREKQF